MKSITTLALLLAFAITSLGQQNSVNKLLTIKTDYLKKSKNQKKAAWIMVGGGSALLLTGILIPKGESKGFTGTWWGLPVEGYKNDNIKSAFGITGVIAMAGSIPLFIASGKNKKRANAATVFVDIQSTPLLHQTEIQNQPTPVL